jgi:hypothetical protein
MICLIVLALGACVQEATERDVRGLILTIVDSKDEGKAKDALNQLKSVRPILAQKTLKSIISEGNQARVPKAISLAVELKVIGLWDSVSRQIDGPDEEQIVKLAFVTQDAAALTTLVQRWAKVDPTTASFKFLESAMKSYGVSDAKHMDLLKNSVGFNDSAHSESATSILCAQFGVSSQGELLKGYEALKAEFLTYGKPRVINGADMASFLKNQGVRRLGANLKVKDGAKIELESLPDFIKSGNVTFSLEVFPVDGTLEVGFVVDSKGENRYYRVKLDSKDWYLRTGDGMLLAIPAQFNAWNKIEFNVFPLTDKPPGHICSRHVSILIGGKNLLDGGCMGGEWKGIVIESKGAAYVGGISAVKNKK